MNLMRQIHFEIWFVPRWREDYTRIYFKDRDIRFHLPTWLCGVRLKAFRYNGRTMKRPIKLNFQFSGKIALRPVRWPNPELPPTAGIILQIAHLKCRNVNFSGSLASVTDNNAIVSTERKWESSFQFSLFRLD